MWPGIDWRKVGQRVKNARLAKGLTQAQLGAIVGCSNNHISHVEVGQTKLSLTMLLRLAQALDQSCDYFLMDTPYLRRETFIDGELAEKLRKCSPATLLTINGIVDLLLAQQALQPKEEWNEDWGK